MSLAGSLQKFSQIKRENVSKVAKGKLGAAMGKEVGSLINVVGQIVAPNLSAWGSYDEGVKATGIAEGDITSPSMWERLTQKPGDVISDRIYSENMNRSYSTQDIMNIGTLRKSKHQDVLASVEAREGKSIEQIFGRSAESAINLSAKDLGFRSAPQPGDFAYTPQRSTVKGAYGESFGLGKRESMFGMAKGEKLPISTAFQSEPIAPLPVDKASLGSSQGSGPGSAEWNRGLVKKLIEAGELKPGQKLHEHKDFTKGMGDDSYLEMASRVGYQPGD